MSDISCVSDTRWEAGKERAEIIRPLAAQRQCSREEVLKAAKALQLSERYVYRFQMQE